MIVVGSNLETMPLEHKLKERGESMSEENKNKRWASGHKHWVQLRERVRLFRKDATPSEKLLWERLRGSAEEALRERSRQIQVGTFPEEEELLSC